MIHGKYWQLYLGMHTAKLVMWYDNIALYLHLRVPVMPVVIASQFTAVVTAPRQIAVDQESQKYATTSSGMNGEKDTINQYADIFPRINCDILGSRGILGHRDATRL